MASLDGCDSVFRKNSVKKLAMVKASEGLMKAKEFTSMMAHSHDSGNAALAVGRKPQFLATGTSIESCLCFLTTWWLASSRIGYPKDGKAEKIMK